MIGIFHGTAHLAGVFLLVRLRAERMHRRSLRLVEHLGLYKGFIYGDVSNPTGPNGLQAANHLTDSLKKLGIEMFRFKTGTPARVDKRSIDFSKMEEQFGDERVVPFSFSTISSATSP